MGGVVREVAEGGKVVGRVVCGTRGSLRTKHGGGSAPSCCAFTHRVAFEEGSGPRVLLIFFNFNFNFIYLFIYFAFFLKFYFIFKLYITVLVLPNIKMNPPQVYMCSPS